MGWEDQLKEIEDEYNSEEQENDWGSEGSESKVTPEEPIPEVKLKKSHTFMILFGSVVILIIGIVFFRGCSLEKKQNSGKVFNSAEVVSDQVQNTTTNVDNQVVKNTENSAENGGEDVSRAENGNSNNLQNNNQNNSNTTGNVDNIDTQVSGEGTVNQAVNSGNGSINGGTNGVANGNTNGVSQGTVKNANPQGTVQNNEAQQGTQENVSIASESSGGLKEVSEIELGKMYEKDAQVVSKHIFKYSDMFYTYAVMLDIPLQSSTLKAMYFCPKKTFDNIEEGMKVLAQVQIDGNENVSVYSIKSK